MKQVYMVERFLERLLVFRAQKVINKDMTTKGHRKPHARVL